MTADLGGSIHDLTGHSAVSDGAMRVSAEYLVFALVLLLAVLWFHRDGLRVGVAFGLGVVVALAVGAILGSLWSEQRPFVVDHFTPLVAHSTDGGFPSDHLLVVGAMVGACWVRARALAWATVGVAVLVAVGRVYVGLHYPVDVVAGFAVGVGCGLAAWGATARLAPLLGRLDDVLRRRGLRRVR
ncbi:MAG: phosphatase PAP2 family protein, partial [Candidatus Dormibacteraeota bacterium]|nr:phosphatase PAP2 family protein [Candidatus Dormibacteraeota bacterium]